MSENHPICFRSLLSSLLIALLAGAGPVGAEKLRLVFSSDSTAEEINSNIYPIVVGSDSIFCGGIRLERESDYQINYRNGRINVNNNLSCDSLVIIVYRIPDWLAQSSGNSVPLTGGYLRLPVETEPDSTVRRPGGGKINLSGNKSFSFNVGRSGDGVFSQGLNIDFDAEPSPGLKIRGAISDRIGGENRTTASGETILISELDKYYFEIEGRLISARGGDISSLSNQYVPVKRIKGIYSAYCDSRVKIEGDLGRPAGRFRTQKIQGIDDRQGPYQLLGEDGLSTAVTAGSETVYLDGQKLKGSRGGDYEIDYYTGQLTFLPGILITSRSRIEVDFETTQSYYEQLIYDGNASINFIPDRLIFILGARRETDNKDKLQIGSLSSSDIDLLQDAGDSSTLAQKSGVTAMDSGSYVAEVDTAGTEYYRYVGAGNGDYEVSFSQESDSSGSYNYLGDGIYEYVGASRGDYNPVVHIPLPQRTDMFFAATQALLSPGFNMELAYQLNIRDKNLMSDKDDSDNDRSQFQGAFNINRGAYRAKTSARYRREGFDPANRIYLADYSRSWALPDDYPAGDEIIIKSSHRFLTESQNLNLGGGYIDYSDNLEGYRIAIDGSAYQKKAISPALNLQYSRSQKKNDNTLDGQFVKFCPALTVRPIGAISWEVAYDYENLENHYDSLPDDESYRTYLTTLHYRNSYLTLSRRTDRSTMEEEIDGPRLDRLDVKLEESYKHWTVSLGGTWLEQKRLDSDRDDLSELLLQGHLQYSSRGGWLNISAVYLQNREETRASAFRYYAVDPGTGDYRYEEGQYLLDPDGDYIRLREETGEYRSVSTGEKSHVITFYPGRISLPRTWKNILSQITLNLRTEVREEMTGDAKRKWNWLIPWVSDSDKEFASRTRAEQYQMRLFPAHNFYLVTFEYNHSFSEEEDASDLYRSKKEYRLEYKYQFIPSLRLRLEALRALDAERGSGLSTLEMVSDFYTTGLIYNEGAMQLEPSFTYNRFKDAYSSGRGRGISFELSGIYRATRRGEIRYNITLRSLKEQEPFSQPEYLVTEGRRFGRSILLNLNTSYDLGASLRLNLNVTDRIFENRAPEFVGRGELVASF